MAHRVLLVDDEVFDLEWLKKAVPWGELGLQLAGTAHSGFEALKLMDSLSIAILISDIRMPIMTGLEMAKLAKERRPDLKIIFISGYEDFQYAKRAIALSASGYVLKPINLDEVVKLLKETVRSIAADTHLQHKSETLDRTLPLLRAAFVHEWLEGGRRDKESQMLLESYGFHAMKGSYNIAVIELDDLDWKLNRFPKGEQEAIIREAQKSLADWVNEASCHLYVHQQRMTLLFEAYEEKRALELLQLLVDRTRDKGIFTITIGIGLTPVHAVEDLPDLYKQAKELLEYKMFVGKNRTIRSEDIKTKVIQTASNTEEKLDQLLTCMLNYDLVGIDDHVMELFDYVQHAETKVSVYNFTLHLISQLDKQFVRVGESLYDILAWDYKNLDVLFQFETMDDILSWLRRRLFEIAELMMLKMQKGNHKLVQDIQSYTSSHLQEKLTLKSLSTRFGFTPNYLGHLFKDETGENYTDYLMRRRMEKASELLSDPMLKIYEVSDAVGYKNIIYFNRHFKEFYGITPTEFRRKR